MCKGVLGTAGKWDLRDPENHSEFLLLAPEGKPSCLFSRTLLMGEGAEWAAARSANPAPIPTPPRQSLCFWGDRMSWARFFLKQQVPVCSRQALSVRRPPQNGHRTPSLQVFPSQSWAPCPLQPQHSDSFPQPPSSS